MLGADTGASDGEPFGADVDPTLGADAGANVVGSETGAWEDPSVGLEASGEGSEFSVGPSSEGCNTGAKEPDSSTGPRGVGTVSNDGCDAGASPVGGAINGGSFVVGVSSDPLGAASVGPDAVGSGPFGSLGVGEDPPSLGGLGVSSGPLGGTGVGD